MHKQVCMSQVFQTRTTAAGSVLKKEMPLVVFSCVIAPGWEMSAVRCIDLGLWDNKLPV